MLVVRSSVPDTRAEPPLVIVRTYWRQQLMGVRTLRTRRGPRPSGASSFVVGSGPRVSAPLPAPPGLLPEDHELVRSDGDGARVWLRAGMRAAILAPGARATSVPQEASPDGTQEVPLAEDERLELSCGGLLRFELELERAPLLVSRPGLRRTRAALSADALSLGLVGPLVALALMLPRDPKTIAFDPDLAARRFIALLVRPPARPERDTSGESVSSSSRGSKRAAATTGRDPSSRASAEPTGRAMARAAHAMRPADQREDPRRAGILGALRGGAISALLDRGASAFADQGDPLEGLAAFEGVSSAAAGLPGPGTGTRGAGGDDATIGPEGLETIGRDGPADHGYSQNEAALSRLDPRPRHSLVIPTGEARVRGGLDKEIVRRAIRQHINEVRFCYERALVRRPDLAGRLVVRFLIGADGLVRAAVPDPEGTMPDVQVASCVVAAVRRWAFPAPRGGGLVDVRYPFVFTTNGG